MVKLLFFAAFKDIMKTSEIAVELTDKTNLDEFLEKTAKEYPALENILKIKNYLIAINHEFAEKDQLVKDGDEIAFIAPMSGGSDQELIRIQKDNFSVDEEITRIKKSSGSIGGIAVFLGTGRDISKGQKIDWLEFEHYPQMAEKQLAKIRKQALKDFDIIEVGIVHRIGHIEIGENIVLITVGAKHRKDAFAACRWCIDELKKITPIWKKEKTRNGEIWVEEHP